MRFSFWPNAGQDWSEILDVSLYAERTGWDGIWIADHFMPMAGDLDVPMHECWSVLAALAAAVPRVRLGALVAGITYRNPAVLAKQAVTIDHVSGGRLVLGIGAGWQENEHAAYGIALGTIKERLDRFEEACQIITGLLNEDRTTFDGHHYRSPTRRWCPRRPPASCRCSIGGGGEKRTMRIAARVRRRVERLGRPGAAGGQAGGPRPPLRGHRPRPGLDHAERQRAAVPERGRVVGGRAAQP